MSLHIAHLGGADCVSEALLPLFGLNMPPALLAPLAQALAAMCRQCERPGLEEVRAYAQGIITGQLAAQALTLAQADQLQALVNQTVQRMQVHIKDEAPSAPTVGDAA